MTFFKQFIFLAALVATILSLPAALLVQASGVDTILGGAQVSADKAGIDTSVERGTAATQIAQIIGGTLNMLFAVVGVIFLVVILVGGYMWMTAGGGEEKIQKAKHLIANGINGMIVMFLAYSLGYIILLSLNTAITTGIANGN
jgi:hypothetical protein